jgi:hypothetical protein
VVSQGRIVFGLSYQANNAIDATIELLHTFVGKDTLLKKGPHCGRRERSAFLGWQTSYKCIPDGNSQTRRPCESDNCCSDASSSSISTLQFVATGTYPVTVFAEALDNTLDVRADNDGFELVHLFAEPDRDSVIEAPPVAVGTGSEAR